MVYVPSSRFTTAPQRGLWFAFRKRELLVRADFTLPAELWLEELQLTPVRSQYLGQWKWGGLLRGAAHGGRRGAARHGVL
jgi:hypothetical protein